MTDTIATSLPEGTATSDATQDPMPATDLEHRVAELERRVENNRLIRDTWTLIIFAIAAVALLASIFAVGLAMRAIDESSHPDSTDVHGGATTVVT